MADSRASVNNGRGTTHTPRRPAFTPITPVIQQNRSSAPRQAPTNDNPVVPPAFPHAVPIPEPAATQQGPVATNQSPRGVLQGILRNLQNSNLRYTTRGVPTAPSPTAVTNGANQRGSDHFTDAEVSALLRSRNLPLGGTPCERRIHLIQSEMAWYTRLCESDGSGAARQGNRPADSHLPVNQGPRASGTRRPPTEPPTSSQRENSSRAGRAGNSSQAGQLPLDADAQGAQWKALENRMIAQSTVRISVPPGSAYEWGEDFIQLPIDGAGNRLFHAFAMVYYGTEGRHQQVATIVQDHWAAAFSDDTVRLADGMRHLYTELDEQAASWGDARGDYTPNDHLHQQIIDHGLWASIEMFQILADAFDVTLIIHNPMIDGYGNFRWEHIVRRNYASTHNAAAGIRPQQRQIHLVWYRCMARYVAIRHLNPPAARFEVVENIYFDNLHNLDDIYTILGRLYIFANPLNERDHQPAADQANEPDSSVVRQPDDENIFFGQPRWPIPQDFWARLNEPPRYENAISPDPSDSGSVGVVSPTILDQRRRAQLAELMAQRQQRRR